MALNCPNFMELTFDEKAHEYRLGERVLPSVTEILKDAGLIDSRYFNDYAATRGTYVHQACAMFDQGTLDEDALDHALAGYVSAYKKFRAECPAFTWEEIETPHHDAALGFAGTPDRIDSAAIVDLKCGAPQKWHGQQLAAYSILTNKRIRFGLYLREDGTYRLNEYKDRSDFDIFRASLTLFHAKRTQ